MSLTEKTPFKTKPLIIHTVPENNVRTACALMVLRKERPPGRVETGDTAAHHHNAMNNEQPESKRQRIDGLNGSYPDASDPLGLNTHPPPLPSSDLITKRVASQIHDFRCKDDADEPDHVALRICETKTHLDDDTGNRLVTNDDWQPLQSSLTNQCLCDMTDEALQRTFQSHYVSTDPTNKHDTVLLTLSEWPYGKLIPFLSNLQMLFEIYLKQSRVGKVCGRIKDICDALQLSDEYTLITDIIGLGDSANKYVQYLAGRVVSTFLVIAQERPAACDEWLEKLVDYLPVGEEMDKETRQRTSFTMDIFQRILEWQDVEVHPLDDDSDAEIEEEILSPVQQPPIENNYFNFYSDFDSTPIPIVNSINTVVVSPPDPVDSSTSSGGSSSTSSSKSSSLNVFDGGTFCQFVHLDDYYCMDTTKLKKDTVRCFESKWPTLFRTINHLIVTFSPATHHNENLILTFIDLWQKIISGAGGKEPFLSVTDTDPFYAQLDSFHLHHELPPRIYMQILGLFNAVLCYGDSLALQDNLPEKTCNLAHRIINQVKDNSRRGLLSSVPIRSMDNPVSLIGYLGRSVDDTMRHPENYTNRLGSTSNLTDSATTTATTPIDPNSTSSYSIDKTFLRSMVLLVLKSVAVSVREMRSDSSDSSIDSNDTEAYADFRTIAQTMRPVLKKIDIFAKNKLQLHPEYHFSKTLVKLFLDQDDHLVEAMVCTLDVAIGFTIRSSSGDEPAFAELIRLLNPVYTFLEFLNATSMSCSLLLNYLISNETCFLLYFLRFLKYITKDWWHFDQSCREFGEVYGLRNVCDKVMAVMHSLRLEISRMVANRTFPYDISPIRRLLETCESLHGGGLHFLY